MSKPDLMPLAEEERSDLLALLRNLTPAPWGAPSLCIARRHIPGAAHLELSTLNNDESAALPTDRRVVTVSAHGQRSLTGASLLARQRGTTRGLAVYTGSAQDWAHHTQRTLSEGT